MAAIIFEYVREESITKLTILFENLNLDPNVQDSNGNYPIHFIQTVEIGKILRMAGAKLFRSNQKGQSPIHSGSFQYQNYVFVDLSVGFSRIFLSGFSRNCTGNILRFWICFPRFVNKTY